MLFLSGQDYGQFSMQLGEEVTHFEVLQLENGHGRVRIGSKTESFTYHLAADGLHLSLSAADHLLVNDLAPGAAGSDEEADGIITAEMHGLVTAVHIEPGQMVEAGQRVLLLEAMKMQHDIKSPVSGKVIEVTAAEGQQVASGDRLVIIDQQEEQTS
jgi:biotin carboxyl carrier protein